MKLTAYENLQMGTKLHDSSLLFGPDLEYENLPINWTMPLMQSK